MSGEGEGQEVDGRKCMLMMRRWKRWRFLIGHCMGSDGTNQTGTARVHSLVITSRGLAVCLSRTVSVCLYFFHQPSMSLSQSLCLFCLSLFLYF